jgi:hypothetical protein
MTLATATSAIRQFASEVLEFELFPRQAEILEEVYRDEIRTAVLRLGRRAGKGRMAALVAVYEATVRADQHLPHVMPGEQVAIVVVAPSRESARIVHGYARQFLSRPKLAALVVRDTVDELELSNGLVIVTVPAHAAAARGHAAAVVVFDEAAWFQGRDGSPLDAKEIADALVPSTAQFPAGRVLILSTPRWSVGWFADQVQLADSGAASDMRAWHETTADVNPKISRTFLEAERAKDPAMFRREYEAEFDSGIGAVFDDVLVRAAVRLDVQDLPPTAGEGYMISVDPAFTGDTFACLVGHDDTRSGKITLDRVFGWRGTRAAPVQIDVTLDELASISLAYGGAPVVTDQYSAQTIVQGLRARGVAVFERPWTNEAKVDAVAAVRQRLYAGRLSLPDHRALVAELVTLEQRPTPGGRPRIAAPGRAHDDYATALMMLVDALTEAPAEEGTVFYDPRRQGFVDDPSDLTPSDPFSLYTPIPIPELEEDGWSQ